MKERLKGNDNAQFLEHVIQKKAFTLTKCDICGSMSVAFSEVKIIDRKDKTVSATFVLHCEDCGATAKCSEQWTPSKKEIDPNIEYRSLRRIGTDEELRPSIDVATKEEKETVIETKTDSSGVTRETTYTRTREASKTWDEQHWGNHDGRYDIKCPDCGWEKEVFPRNNKRDIPEHCPSCGIELNRR